MRHRTLLATSAVFSALTVSLVALGGGAGDQERVPAAEKGAQQDQGLEKYYVDSKSCAACHDNKEFAKKSQLCRFNEAQTWKNEDKHQNAFQILRGDRAKAMGDLLGIADVSKENRCVACHGVVVEAGAAQDNFNQEEGVTCVACHGAYRRWIIEHTAPAGRLWRSLTREQKERDYGMVDLWDPAIRSKKCASCHVGNADDGKFLTHEMYAAGHPPLPGIEAAQFSDQEPRHWQYLFEKPAEIQKFLQFNDKELEQSKLVVVDGVVALRESIKLLADDAKRPKSAAQSLDLTHFDCYACHHDLKGPSWRQERGYPGNPGRPRPRPWPKALAKLALQHLGQPDDVLETKLADLNKAFNDRPFGNPGRVAEEAAKVVKWLDGIATAAGKASCGRKAAADMLPMLCAIADETPDYDSARQIAWAFETIYNELHRDDQHPADPKVLDVLKALKAELKLDLPKGIKPGIIVDQLDDSLQHVADYDPARFRARMAELKVLPGVGPKAN
ncbi:MAG TPA: multiheme c-type cytochrome [Isosphaeraceae bacterium]|jgi:hypothetical protein|nr:multiheme c-type cytochrome [Isosphaeraceae bacterium]